MAVYKDPTRAKTVGDASLVTANELRWSPWVTPVLDTSAYAAGDALCVALLRLPDILPEPTYKTTAVGLIVEDTSSTPQNIGLTVWLFDRSEITTPSLNSAWTLVAADRDSLVACITSGPFNTSTATGRSERWDIRVPLRSTRGNRDLWMLPQTLGAPTYSSASSLRLRLVVQD